MANLLDVLVKVKKGNSSGVEGRLYDYVMRLLDDPAIINRNPGEYAVLLASLPQATMPELKSIPASEMDKQLRAIAALDAISRSQLRMTLASTMQQIQIATSIYQTWMSALSNMAEAKRRAADEIVRNFRG